MTQPAQLEDLQKSQLAEKHSAYLQPAKNKKDEFVLNQPIWFTEDGTTEWKPGFVESHDPHLDSYWIINEQNSHRVRRNKHDLKPHYMVVMEKHQPPPPPAAVPMNWETVSTPTISAPQSSSGDLFKHREEYPTIQERGKDTCSKENSKSNTSCFEERDKFSIQICTHRTKKQSYHQRTPTGENIQIQKDHQGQ